MDLSHLRTKLPKGACCLPLPEAETLVLTPRSSGLSSGFKRRLKMQNAHASSPFPSQIFRIMCKSNSSGVLQT